MEDAAPGIGRVGTASAHVVGAWALDDDLMIGGDDAHHFVTARRLRVGETVTVSPGDGTYRSYDVASLERHALELRSNSQVLHTPAPEPITLAFVPPKGDRWELIVRAGTELGVTEFVPLRSERGVAQWHDRSKTRAAKIITEAMNQSRRCWRPQLGSYSELCDWLADRSPGSTARADTPRYAQPAAPDALRSVTAVVIGPEGGFSDRERSVLESCPPLVVGNGVLRSETACIVAVSALFALRQFGTPL